MTDQALKNPPTLTTAPRKWLWVSTSIAIVGVVIGLRLLLNFRHSLAPGMDAAYYPMQTWWLIEYGKLMNQPPPLIFWLNPLLAQSLQWLTAMSLDEACLLASRIIDSVAQPWVAVPVMALGYRWALGRREALLACASAAVLAVASPPIMRMASDFQKNSLGLVWMAFGIWAMREALSTPRSIWRWLRLAIFVTLAALTHMGAFGATCVILAGCGIGYCLVVDFPSSESIASLLACRNRHRRCCDRAVVALGCTVMDHAIAEFAIASHGSSRCPYFTTGNHFVADRLHISRHRDALDLARPQLDRAL